MKYTKPEMLIVSKDELETMIKGNASACGYLCMVSHR
mgnify:CR=1 FL=1